MKSIFESREFSKYQKSSLQECRNQIPVMSQYAKSQKTVFLSHKHDDLEDLKDVIGFLEKEYDVKVYIDSRDPSMPPVTSGETAENIKKRIKQCDKFILLATNGAIESKWCNWELGFGDDVKFPDNIALFPFKPKDQKYVGNEYMSIYPYVAYYNGSDTYLSGTPIKEGYYVHTENSKASKITPLKEWLSR